MTAGRDLRGAVVAVVGASITLVAAYIIEKKKPRGEQLLYGLSVLPAAIPGVVLGLGYVPMAPPPLPCEPIPGIPAFPVLTRLGVTTDPALAHALHIEIAGLKADRPYWYRFTAMGEQSAIGRARTAPARNSPW